MPAKTGFVLVFHGSFNPLHLGHVEAMRQASRALEVEGYNVIRGVVAMADAAYVERKKGQCLKDIHRVQALLLGFQDLPWVQINTQFPRFKNSNQMRNQLWWEFCEERSHPDGEIAVFCLCGDDVVERYNYVDDWSVVVGRTATPTFVDQVIQKKQVQGRGKVIRANMADKFFSMSSTIVRTALLDRSYDVLQESCPSAVTSYLCELSASSMYVEQDKSEGRVDEVAASGAK